MVGALHHARAELLGGVGRLVMAITALVATTEWYVLLLRDRELFSRTVLTSLIV
jgi:hypothetical protein